jgi:hypothetical protein
MTGQDEARGGFEAALRREFETLRPETATRGKEDRIQAILSAHDTALAGIVRDAIDAYVRQAQR